MTSHNEGSSPDALPLDSIWRNALKWTWIASVGTAVVAATIAPTRFFQAYLVGFTFLTTLGLGAQFFVLLHHLVQARWSGRACLRMESVASLLRIAPLLFLPIAWQARRTFPWLHDPTHALSPHSAKATLMALPFFLGRASVYLFIWWILATFFRHPRSSLDAAQRGRSIAQQRRWCGPAMVAYAWTTIFASFDWWMSIQGEFHSGIFGVYIFAGAVVGSLALLALSTALDGDATHCAPSAATEERHDIGKLIFGFVVFWGYVAFCQYLLIWYSDLPTETAFYSLRWTRPWRFTTSLLVALQFVIPAVVFCSRNTKRSRFDHIAIALVLLAAHLVDVLWIVMPPLALSDFDLGIAEAAIILLVVNATLTILWRIRLRLREESDVAPDRTPERSRIPESPDPSSAADFPAPLGAHVVALATVTELPPVGEDAWRSSTLGPSVAVAALAIFGGIAMTSSFETRLRVEQFRKAVVSDASRAPSAVESKVPSLDEYRWIDRQHSRLRIPIARAVILVISEYRCRPSPDSLSAAPSAPK